jgi:signal transduction histidine kinase
VKNRRKSHGYFYEITSIEAMPDGGVIHILTDNDFLDAPFPGVCNFKPGEYVRLEVTDQGIGISEEDRDRIF